MDNAIAAAGEVTAKSLYDLCESFSGGEGFPEGSVVRHFQLTADALEPGEQVIGSFIGLHNYLKASEHDGEFAFVITNKRIIIARQLASRKIFQTIDLADISSVELTQKTFIARITLNTVSGLVYVGMKRKKGPYVQEWLNEAVAGVKVAA